MAVPHQLNLFYSSDLYSWLNVKSSAACQKVNSLRPWLEKLTIQSGTLWQSCTLSRPQRLRTRRCFFTKVVTNSNEEKDNMWRGTIGFTTVSCPTIQIVFIRIHGCLIVVNTNLWYFEFRRRSSVFSKHRCKLSVSPPENYTEGSLLTSPYSRPL